MAKKNLVAKRAYTRTTQFEVAECFSFIKRELAQSEHGLNSAQLKQKLLKYFEFEVSDDKLNGWLKSLCEGLSISVKFGDKLFGFGEYGHVPRPRIWVLNEGQIEGFQTEIITALRLVKKFLPFLVRYSQIRRFDSTIEVVCKKFPKTMNKKISRWVDSVDIASRYPSIYPNFNGKSESDASKIIMDAMFEGRGFKATYADAKGCNKLETFYPVKLIRREHTSYMTCLKGDAKRLKAYAIHRFSKIEETSAKRSDAQNAYRTVDASVDHKSKSLKTLIIDVRGASVSHLSKVTFAHPDKKGHGVETKNIDGGVRLTITKVKYTYQLKAWMLGLGKELTVLEPEYVRNDIVDELSAALSGYE